MKGKFIFLAEYVRKIFIYFSNVTHIYTKRTAFTSFFVFIYFVCSKLNVDVEYVTVTGFVIHYVDSYYIIIWWNKEPRATD